MRNNYKEIICSNVAYLRKTHGLSRTAMSKKLHITLKTLDLLEQGIFPHRTNFGIVYYIADAFQVSVHDVMYTRLEETAVPD
ncbi:MAG: helix-turn-helix transcriptional regulator [Clostridia bacterium]|nr:helix-turn-helix transcriptional regulator [Clostridia bacterium]